MRVWADIYDAAGNRLGDGPVQTITQASITRRLDEAGDFKFQLPGTDPRALDLIANKRRARIFLEHQGVTREVTRGIIEKIGAADQPSGWSRSADGPDDLAELKFASVLLGRKYDAETVNDIVDDLLGLVTGWTRSGSITTQVSARYDGVSVLKALKSLVQQQGIHFRKGAAGVLEVGAFGTDSGKRLVNAVYAPADIYENDDIILIERFGLNEDSEEIVNWLLPLGGGRGDAAITLEKSTRTTPYTIQTMSLPDGRTAYYLSDSTSITAYGQVQKIGTFKDISPISNSEADQVAAANALYDAAAAWLSRYSQKFTSYDVRCKKVLANLNPGDKIHVRYKGVIENDDGVIVDYRDINGDFWVLEVGENISTGGVSTDLKIASVDRYEQDAARVVLGALEEIRLNNVSVEPYFSKSGFVYRREIDATHDAVVPIDLTDATASLVRCRVRLTTRPFRATAKSAQSVTSASGGGSSATSTSGGEHYHRIGNFLTDSNTLTTRRVLLGYGTNTTGDQPVGFTAFISEIGTYGTPGPVSGQSWWTAGAADAHTHNVTIPAHTHTIPAANLTYGITDDVSYPNTVRIAVNGTDQTSTLGGPWAVGGSALDVVLELADAINAAATLQQKHTVTISCDSGQGEVEVNVELYEVIQSISVF